jgi:hypothetical protein
VETRAAEGHTRAAYHLPPLQVTTSAPLPANAGHSVGKRPVSPCSAAGSTPTCWLAPEFGSSGPDGGGFGQRGDHVAC